MAWSNSLIDFWSPSSSWGQNSTIAAAANQAAILALFQDLYARSATARAVFDDLASKGLKIKIAAGEYDRPAGTRIIGEVEFLAIDYANLSRYSHINENGVVVSSNPALTLFHEVMHLDVVGNLVDAAPILSGGQYVNLDAYDFDGQVIPFQNRAAAEMGLTDQAQASYSSGAFQTDFGGWGLTSNQSYSDGSFVKNVIISKTQAADQNDFIILDGRTDPETNLVFGLNGDDNIIGGKGTDYLYGGEGVDTLSGDQGRDKLLGENGDDFLDGGAGDDILIGGDAKDEILGGAGNDILYDGTPGEIFQDDDVLEGGAGDDWLVSNGGGDKMTGGAGNDHFLINLSPAARRVDVLDFDVGDKLVWNGYALTGGLYTLIDAETPVRQYGTFTDFQYSFIAYLGPLGEIYRYASSLAQLTINLPDGSTVIVQDFTNGEGGITLAQRTRDAEHERDWFWSNIVNDGKYNLDELDGRAASLATRGGIANPEYTLSVAGAPDPTTPTNPTGPIQGDNGNNRIEGTIGNDVINAYDGDDEIYGFAGNDLISGGTGNDLINGGEGDDTVRLSGVQSDYSLVRNADGSVTITDGRGVDGADTLYSVETLQFEGDQTLAVLNNVVADYGTTGNDGWVEGTSGADFLYGLDGDDVLAGRGGNDVYEGGGGEDTVSLLGLLANYTFTRNADGSVSVNDITGADGVDLLRGVEGVFFEGSQVFRSITSLVGEHGTEAADSWIEGSVGNDTLYGLGGDDTLVGRAGNDRLDGGSGFDQANYVGSFADFVFDRRADGSIVVTDTTGGEGSDTLVDIEAVYFDGDQTWKAIGEVVAGYGTVGDDAWVEGTLFSDNIYGLEGDDTLVGREGDDFLYGGEGFDQANYFGSSTDFSFVQNADGSVTVTDLVGNEGVDILSGIEAIYFDGDQVWGTIEDALAQLGGGAGARQALPHEMAASPVLIYSGANDDDVGFHPVRGFDQLSDTPRDYMFA